MKKYLSLGLGLIVVLGGFFVIYTAKAIVIPPVIINEFSSASGPEWVELLNTTGSDIDLTGWTIQDLANPAKSLSDLGTIPANGIVVFEQDEGWLNNDPSTETITIFDDTSTPIHSINYGSDSEVDLDAPTNVQSGEYIEGSWSISDNPSKGWFNDAGAEGAAPLLEDIDDFLAEAGINSNIGELDNPSATPDTEGEGDAFGALYFEKTVDEEDVGKIVFEATLNLSDQDTVAILQELGEKMEMSDGHIEFDSATADAMNATGAKIYMYGLDFDSEPDIIVRDDEGTTIDGTDIIDDVSYDPETGELSFTAAHFTQFDAEDADTTAPVIVPTIDAIDSNTIEVTFNEDLQNDIEGHHPNDSDFRVYNGESYTADPDNSYSIDSVSYANKKVTITLTDPILAEDNPHLDIIETRTSIVDLADNFFDTESEYDHKVYTAPVITEETATTSVTTSSIVITWTTNHPATSRVIYDTISHSELGEAPNYGYANSTGTYDEDPMVTSHSVTVSGLTADTNYFFRTVSHGSPEAVSSEFSGTTSSASGGGGGISSSGNRPRSRGTVLGATTSSEEEVLGAEKFVFTLFLKVGPPYNFSAQGNEVMELQKFLDAAGYGILVVDGKFGPLTKVALIKFQLANGLVGDGIVGPLTRAVLNQ